ncbi:hypothetical protein [Catenulispora pinisilvae]|uniref:hypothetical protein n=1 Tax=Catenulispora pinisilvae TaxID=2705253 RepID=UPI001892704F|nr:hypothetical protein [Catenulispora pinisilvae]
MSNDVLQMDADAMDGFSAQLRDLMQCEFDSLYPDTISGGMGGIDAEHALADLANTTTLIGQRLDSYLSALAKLADASAQAARAMDQNLAAGANSLPSTPSQPHKGRGAN